MNESLLNDEEIQPVTLIKGDSPLIIAGPHNGYIVPQPLYDAHNHPLGLHPSAFDPKSPFRRHEACDWGIADLFEALQNFETQPPHTHNYIAGNYSRLVIDLNRDKDISITTESCETGNIVPGNIDIEKSDLEQRVKDVYTPYHEALKTLIDETKARFGYAIFLDLHSFTPTWKGENRNVHIGTLAHADHFVERHISKYLTAACAAYDLHFGAHQPYNLKKQEHRKASLSTTIESYGVFYTGLEIRNDLLSTKDSIQNIAQLINEATSELINHHNKMVFVKAKETLISV